MNEPSFLIFSAMSNPMFRTMRLRNKKKDCAICGETPTMTELIDYVQFCDGSADDKVSCMIGGQGNETKVNLVI